MRKASKKGFTIIELVVVIAVIAILAAVLIPTFASLINKANESVDMQLVKQMNTVLTAEELTDGKPATVVDAQKVLSDNGIMQIKPVDENNVFYWIGTDNRVLLWEKDEDDPATTGKVIYPSESKKKYSDVTTPSADWADLSVEYNQTNYIEIEVTEGQDAKDAMLNAIKNAGDGAIIRLPKGATIDVSEGGLGQLTGALQTEIKVGKRITIDLNGSTIFSGGASLSTWCVSANGELILTNGSVTLEHRENNEKTDPSTAGISLQSGARLVMRNVDFSSKYTAGILPAGEASEVVIDNCNITVCNFAVSTNRAESSNIRISINNSNLTATDCTPILINTPSYTTISNSTITGVTHAAIVRAGAVTIENSTLSVTEVVPGDYSYVDFGTETGHWWTGNAVPAAALVIGDYYSKSSTYSGDVTADLTNVTLKTADATTVPTVIMAAFGADKNVKLNYDEASTVGEIVVYGTNWKKDVASPNHKGIMYVNNQPAKLENNTTKIGE